MPDANAAESIGRLPGVAIERSAGEGSKVNIRGLSPRFSIITINGQKIPGTGDDRSVDLSMISQYVLQGIELYKTTTPDQYGDATAGSVNFVIRQAPVGFRSQLDGQVGFNTLSNQLRDYKISATGSNRFFKNKLGVLATGTAHRADRGRDMFDVDYRPLGIDVETEELLMEVISLNLIDQLETRRRYTASLVLDYDLAQNHRLRTISFFSQTNRDILARQKVYAPSFGDVQHQLSDTERQLVLWSNMLDGSHALGFVEAEWVLSASSTVDETPFRTGLTFEENAPFTGELIDDRGPFPIPDAAKNNLDQTGLSGGGNRDENRAKERDLSARLDLKTPFSSGSSLSGYFKFGGLHTDKLREFRAQGFRRSNSTNFLLIRDNPGELQIFNGSPTVNNFVDPDFDPGDFMDGRFEFNVRLPADLARDIYERYADSLAIPTRFATLDDYHAEE